MGTCCAHCWWKSNISNVSKRPRRFDRCPTKRLDALLLASLPACYCQTPPPPQRHDRMRIIYLADAWCGKLELHTPFSGSIRFALDRKGTKQLLFGIWHPVWDYLLEDDLENCVQRLDQTTSHPGTCTFVAGNACLHPQGKQYVFDMNSFLL